MVGLDETIGSRRGGGFEIGREGRGDKKENGARRREGVRRGRGDMW